MIVAVCKLGNTLYRQYTNTLKHICTPTVVKSEGVYVLTLNHLNAKQLSFSLSHFGIT